MAKDQLHEAFLALRARGLSYEKIHKRIGVSKQTQVKWAKKFASELEALRGEELDAMVDRCMVAKKHRVQRFASQLERIEDELAKRDLRELSTDSLFRNWVRILGALKGEIEPHELAVDIQLDPGMNRYFEILARCGEVVEEVIPAAVSHLAGS